MTEKEKNGIKIDRENLEYMPNQKMHQIVSFIKSSLRIAACAVGAFVSIEIGFITLGVAEIVGIIEELV